jgi:U3 small nucleolar RNA-associated protein MPP10
MVPASASATSRSAVTASAVAPMRSSAPRVSFADDEDAEVDVDNGDLHEAQDESDEEVEVRSTQFFAKGQPPGGSSKGAVGSSKSKSKSKSSKTTDHSKALKGLEDGFFTLDGFDDMTDRLEAMDGLDVDVDLNRSDAGDEDDDGALDMAQGDDHDQEEAKAKLKKQSATSDKSSKSGIKSSNKRSGDVEDAFEDGATATYKDFFGDPDDLEDDEDDNEDEDDDDDDDDDEDEEVDDVEDDDLDGRKVDKDEDDADRPVKSKSKSKSKSNANAGADTNADVDPGEKSEYEKYSSRMADMIAELEGQAIAPKDWQLRGESSGRDRPQASLLETHLEYDSAAKLPAPITEESTAELETLIKQRIRDQAFDDVVRKVDMKDRAFRAPSELNQEKSKLGLAEIYEQEFVAQATAAAGTVLALLLEVVGSEAGRAMRGGRSHPPSTFVVSWCVCPVLSSHMM